MRKRRSDIDTKLDPAPEIETDERIAEAVARDPRNARQYEIQRYIGQMRDYPLLSREEEIVWVRRLRKGHSEALKTLVYSNIRLVLSLAVRLEHFGIPLLDLVQEGVLGLMRALEDFDVKRGNKLSTYASPWIWRYMLRAIQDKSTRTPMRVPVHVQDDLGKIIKVANAFERRHGRAPTDGEVHAVLRAEAEARQVKCMPLERVVQLRVKGLPFGFSLDARLHAQRNSTRVEDDATIGDVFADPDAPTTDAPTFSSQLAAEQAKLLDRAEKRLQRFDERMHRVIRHRFGLDGNPRMGLREIGMLFDLTRERIRQIETEALYRLGRYLKLPIDRVRFLLSACGDIAAEALETGTEGGAQTVDEPLALLEEHAILMPSGLWRVPAPVATLIERAGATRVAAESAIAELVSQARLRGDPPYAQVFLTAPPAHPNPMDGKPRAKKSVQAKKA